MAASARDPRVPIALLATGLAMPVPAQGMEAWCPHGESLRWRVSYLGVTGGFAEVRTECDASSHATTTGSVRNAPWYAKLYSIDDRVRSQWDPRGGAVLYETWFREGNYRQDEVMKFSPDTFEVVRRKPTEQGWHEWTRSYPSHPAAEDPVSVFFRLRTLDLSKPQAIPVFSGSRTWMLRSRLLGKDVLEDTPVGTIEAIHVALETAHEGDIEQRGRFELWLSDDPRHVPVRMVVKTNLGPVRADLIDYTPMPAPPAATR